jgi:hypothetical protein
MKKTAKTATGAENKRLILIIVFFLCCSFAGAEEESGAEAKIETETKTKTEESPAFYEWIKTASGLLGTTLEDAFRLFGVPLRVSTARGEQPWQDDVVFEYGEGFSLFWYRDRVWQIRFGPEFHQTFSDAGAGSSREEVIAALGKPFHGEDDWILYHFAGAGYPLRARLFFGENGLEDIYLFRGDF